MKTHNYQILSSLNHSMGLGCYKQRCMETNRRIYVKQYSERNLL